MQTGRFTRLAAVGITIVTLALPGLSAAADATVTTGVIIPANNQSCPSPVISGITPYVYGNQLNSFDLTVSDASYVAIVGSVGQTGIPLRQMLRRINPDGSLKIHVDINSTSIPGSVPVSLTLLSSKPGAPTCLTVVSFPVQGSATGTPSQITYPSGPAHPSQPSQPSHPSTSTSGTSSSSTHATSALPVVGGGLQGALSRVCDAAGAYQLWFILLALFMVGVGLVAFAEPPLTRKSTELPAALIVVPLVLLLLFWYAVPACRVAVWIPIVLLIAAALALLAAYREKTPGGTGPAKQLPSPKPQPVKPTTPAAIPMPAGKSNVPMKTTQTTTVIMPNKAEQTKTTVTPTKVEQTKTTVTPAPQPKK
jgi:hypothetical protein